MLPVFGRFRLSLVVCTWWWRDSFLYLFTILNLGPKRRKGTNSSSYGISFHRANLGPLPMSVVLGDGTLARSLFGRGKRQVSDIHACLPGGPRKLQLMPVYEQPCVVCRISQCDKNPCSERPCKMVKRMQLTTKSHFRVISERALPLPFPVCPPITTPVYEGRRKFRDKLLVMGSDCTKMGFECQIGWLYHFDHIGNHRTSWASGYDSDIQSTLTLFFFSNQAI